MQLNKALRPIPDPKDGFAACLEHQRRPRRSVAKWGGALGLAAEGAALAAARGRR